MVTHEFGIFDFAEKANALAVFAVTVRQLELSGHMPHLLLCQVADGEPKARELLLTQTREEVGLVFYCIGRALQQKLAVALLHLGVVP